ncbi:Uncharacterised protein [Vibrio cholerae]|uniref:Uncharacterized protein n=1 Tax=Vibrio cholerae TaxID=666 RepID=A0A655T7W3_VIBCL|nr:Uncharacterised protein [Vibrio cholerae]CSB32412.1 Uncharacterised protein [Vibrio cholerae]CSC51761.1 Uncharacterised protein [Vibrio cholerae]CSC87832.1 Uncharacterised protein [Vibrio cholerae]
MQLRYAAIVTIEEGEEVFGQIALIFAIQCPDYAAVQTNPLRVFRMVRIDEHVTRMHIRMEETVAKHLGEKHTHATFRQ